MSELIILALSGILAILDREIQLDGTDRMQEGRRSIWVQGKETGLFGYDVFPMRPSSGKLLTASVVDDIYYTGWELIMLRCSENRLSVVVEWAPSISATLYISKWRGRAIIFYQSVGPEAVVCEEMADRASR